MLPSIKLFEEKVGQMGISEKDHIVVYDSIGFFSAPRVYWTFKVFGHERISILQGGLPKWINEKRPVESGSPSYPAKEYNSNFKPDLVKKYKDITNHISQCNKNVHVIDARPSGRFDGKDPEPRAGLDSGSMPYSINLPFSNLIDPSTKSLKSESELKKVFNDLNVDINKPIITTCGSGVTASIVYFALKELGAQDVSVYDGSWAEYASIPNSKIIKK